MKIFMHNEKTKHKIAQIKKKIQEAYGGNSGTEKKWVIQATTNVPGIGYVGVDGKNANRVI